MKVCFYTTTLSPLLEPSHQRPTQSRSGGGHMAKAIRQPGYANSHKSEVGETCCTTLSYAHLRCRFVIVSS